MIRKLLLFMLLLNPLWGFTVYEDTSANKSFEDILKVDGEFKKSDIRSLKITESVLWVKYQFPNSTKFAQKKYIVFAFTPLEDVRMYYKNSSGEVVKVLNGTRVKIENRDFKSRKIAFELPLEAKSHTTFYFRLESSFWLRYFHYIFHTPEEFYTFITKNDQHISIGLSAATTILIIVLLIYSYLRDKIYLYYAIFLLSSITLQLLLSGKLGNFIAVQNIGIWLIITVNSLFVGALLFLSEVLDLKNTIKRANFLVNVLIALIVFATIYTIVTKHYFPLTPYVMSLLLLINSYAVYKKVKYAWFIMIGWLFFLIPIIGASIVGNFTSNTQFMQLNTFQILFVCESLIFVALLGYRLRELNKKFIATQQDLFNQSKFATIGEALSNIEHQWRIPLNRISAIETELYTHLKYGNKPSEEEMIKHLESMDDHLQYMSETMSDFRKFYIPDKQKNSFIIGEQIDYAIKVFQYYIEKNNIKIDKFSQSNKSYGYGKDFAQVILNLISNSNNAFTKNKIERPKIVIEEIVLEGEVLVRFMDNAGGVKNEKEIFNLFNSQGSSGIGLHMIRKIIEERLEGKIIAYNNNNGLTIEITLPKK